jgi:hypothetical protein
MTAGKGMPVQFKLMPPLPSTNFYEVTVVDLCCGNKLFQFVKKRGRER